MAIDSTKIAKVKTAMDNRYENKQSNKKTDISGDFAGDTASYPTAQAVKTYVEGKGYISEHQDISGKVDKAQGNNKANLNVVTDASGNITTEAKPTIPTKTSELTNDSNFLSAHQDISGKEDSSNKVSSWSSTTTDTHYPSEKLVKTELDKKIAKSETVGLVKNDGTIDTSTYLTQHQNISGKEDTSNKVTSWSSTTTDTHYPSEKLVKTELDNKISKSQTAGLVKNDGTIDTSSYLTSHQSLSDIGGTVTIEKATSDIGDNIARYTIKQGGSAITNGVIDIPKDFLVKSGEVKTVSTANDPVTGYEIGDKYIDFVINSKDNSATDSHMYIKVSDLVEDTTYTADGSTLQLSNGQFSVKSGGIGTTQLASGVTTSLGYADAWNSSAAKGITSTDISNWNAKGTSNLTTSDVDTQINAALDALAEEINPSQ